MRFRHLLPWTFVAVASISSGQGQAGISDPIFSVVPFDRWAVESEQTHFRWTVRLIGTQLNFHQRLQTRVEVEIDGAELVSRRGHGNLVILVQFQDSSGHAYQTHAMMDLQDVKDDAAKSNIQYFQDALVLPGEYRLSVALFDTMTMEHNLIQKPLRVNALRNDPLPDAWKDLPAVELLQGMEAPDSWFLPYLTGRLRLPLTTRRPIHLEILVNASTSGPSRGLSPGTVNARSLANLVPTLKVLSQIQMDGGGANVTVLDVPKHNIVFQQNAVEQMDWQSLSEALTAVDPNKIDVRSLERNGEQAQYFLNQVRRRLGPAGDSDGGANSPLRVLIIVTAPTSFDSRQEWHPIETAEKPSGKVYYVRLHLPVPRLPMNPTFGPGSRMGRRNSSITVQPPAPPEAFDSLAPLLKPLQPRTFEVYTPEDFRKALDNMLGEIARL